MMTLLLVLGAPRLLGGQASMVATGAYPSSSKKGWFRSMPVSMIPTFIPSPALAWPPTRDHNAGALMRAVLAFMVGRYRLPKAQARTPGPPAARCAGVPLGLVGTPLKN